MDPFVAAFAHIPMKRRGSCVRARPYIPEQSALKPHRRQRMQPLIFASWRVSPQFSQKSTGVGVDGVGGGGEAEVSGATADIMHRRAW